MLSKKKVLNTISNFPDAFSLDELIDKLILLEKIEKGLEDSQKGNVLNEEELENKIKSWGK